MRRILQKLFNVDSLHDLPVEAIRQFTDRYPSCSIGQFVLLKKLQHSEDVSFPGQLQKTIIYFYNPLWLKHQVSGNKRVYKETRPGMAQEGLAINLRPDEPVVQSRDLIEEVVIHQESTYSSADIIDQQTIAFEQARSFPNETAEIAEGQASAGSPLSDTEQGSQLHQPGRPANDESPGMKGQSADKPDHIFQAYHTVDYFASQGIKLSQDVQQGDKLGQQLKSFTEWLKTMRRVPQATVEETAEKADLKEVEKFAANSLEENDVITEAMAEVLLKQGKIDQASTVYTKLSLLNPHKSAYFASKIQEIKSR